MSMYYEGYKEARNEVMQMSTADLLEYIDGMYGRDNLSDNYSNAELLEEALNQCRKDFTDISSSEYELVDFYARLHKAFKAS